MKINVLYYGCFREKTKTTKETLELNNISVCELYSDLKNKYNFDLNIDEILFSINDKYVKNINYLLQDDDSIVLLPPMSGGC